MQKGRDKQYSGQQAGDKCLGDENTADRITFMMQP